MKKISILGSTGSVGQSTVEVILSQAECFDVQAVTAHSNAELLAQQAKELNASQAIIADPAAFKPLKELLSGSGVEVSAGREALLEAASMPCDLVMAAIMGFAGLEPIMKAIEAGANVALANKEPLVAAGPLVMAAAQKHSVTILPVDSEHNAVFQVFDEKQRRAIERIILTASGGPFRSWDRKDMEVATPEQAVAHPNWVMGRKISVDSATLMNKALEVIEAHYLFDMKPENIDVLIHPQSIIHSMVEYNDGSVLAQMGAPDMKTPIAYCLGWPDRMATPGNKLDLNKIINLELEPVDNNKFYALKLAYECLYSGPAFCVAFNAANEIAVQAFLDKQIGFLDIVDTVRHILDKTEQQSLKSVANIVSFDETVRELTSHYISGGAGNREKKEVHAV